MPQTFDEQRLQFLVKRIKDATRGLMCSDVVVMSTWLLADSLIQSCYTKEEAHEEMGDLQRTIHLWINDRWDSVKTNAERTAAE